MRTCTLCQKKGSFSGCENQIHSLDLSDRLKEVGDRCEGFVFVTAERRLTERCFLLSEPRLSRSVLEEAVAEAKATVDSAYTYSRKV